MQIDFSPGRPVLEVQNVLGAVMLREPRESQALTA